MFRDTVYTFLAVSKYLPDLTTTTLHDSYTVSLHAKDERVQSSER